MREATLKANGRILTVVTAVMLTITLMIIKVEAQDRPPHPATIGQLRATLDQNMNHPAIEAKYTALKAVPGFLGLPTSPTTKAPDRFGYYRHYQGGSISIRQKPAPELSAGNREKYAALEWQKGFLGYPTTDELTASDGMKRFRSFHGRVIYWSPATGAQEVQGEILRKWNSLGDGTGPAGIPAHERDENARQRRPV
ncbi:MAG: hypothetical protein IPM55_22910 [Acidobacteria bacterium]|nr:hypothetical protein [Acidobacteriota bacterium]